MKILKLLFSPVFMGSLLIVFAVAMAVATFIENDFGSGAAYSRVYDTRWFELILILLAVNLTGQLIINRLFTKKKLTIALFHLAFILMIIGAGITRYFGWEGVIHIREGETSNLCSSNIKYLGYKVKDPNGAVTVEHSEELNIASISAGSYKKSISAGGKDYK